MAKTVAGPSHALPGFGGSLRRRPALRAAAALLLATLLAGTALLLAFPGIAAPGGPDSRTAREACARNLRAAGGVLVQRATMKGPPGGAVALPRVTVNGNAPRDGDASLLCPLDPARAGAGGTGRSGPLLPGYAVRDLARFPAGGSGAGRVPLAICPWHPDGATALFDDGSVGFLDREALGLRPGEPLVTGPGARSAYLRQFLPPVR
ncbi:MAG: hypothetical protein L6R43_17300 [Planctomycetes bacterium]|nr:hypothetical protein [Planctomycetota bacterium]